MGLLEGDGRVEGTEGLFAKFFCYPQQDLYITLEPNNLVQDTVRQSENAFHVIRVRGLVAFNSSRPVYTFSFHDTHHLSGR